MTSDTTARSDSSGDARRSAIAAATRALIAERGFEGLRTRDIAERVGINVATLHYHVPSKEALVALVAASLRDDFIAQRRDRPRDGLAPLALLRLELGDFRENLTDHPERLLVLAELSERARRDEKIAAIIRPLQAYWLAQVAAIIAAGRDQGAFREDIDPQPAAAMIIGALISFRRLAGDDFDQFDRLAAELERAVVSPVSPRGPQE